MVEAPSTGQPLRSRPVTRRSKSGPKGRRARAAGASSSANLGPASERPPVRSVRLAAPRRPADLLLRPRLIDFIHENVYRKLVLISAAAGYGKSALLSAFAAETDEPLVWLQLAETDRDLVALIGDLAGALAVCFPKYISQLPRLAAQPGAAPADLALALAREIAQTLDEYFVLVLDDFHLVDGVPAVAAFFNTFLDNLPDQAHLLMAGRTLPTLQYARLAAKQQIAGLSEEHLRFRPEEVQELLKLRNRVDMPAGRGRSPGGQHRGLDHRHPADHAFDVAGPDGQPD